MPAIFDRFSTGLLVGVIFALSLSWVLDAEVAEAIKERWVEVFGIVAALFAAVLALLGVQRQIRLQTDQAEAERMSQLRASVAVLPLVLSEFVRTSEACFELSLADASEIRNVDFQIAHIAQSDIASSALDVLRDCIRFSDGVSVGWLSLLARQYQLCRSRFESHVAGDHILLPINHHSMATDWAILRTIANHLFEFSRGEVLQVPQYLSINAVGLPISSRHFGRQIYSDCADYFSRRIARLSSGTAEEFFG
jgi:hypothetical protein